MQLSAEIREVIRGIVAQHGASHPRVFGSVARGEQGPGSDLDIVVTPGPTFSLLDHVAIVQDLEEALRIKVDVATEGGLHWSIRDDVLREAVPV